MTAEQCYSGVVSLPGVLPARLPASLLPPSTCSPATTGLCYSALHTAEGGVTHTAKFGCWPSQDTHIAWLGEPECRSEVGRLVCLCRETLCNSVLARQLQQPRPEGGDTQGGLVLLLLALALLFLPLLFIAFYRAWCSSSSRSHSSDEEKALPALLPVPLYRFHSAPAAMQAPAAAAYHSGPDLNKSLPHSIQKGPTYTAYVRKVRETEV